MTNEDDNVIDLPEPTKPLLPRVIAIAGKMGAGKGTIASVLMNNYNYKPVAIARPIYQMLSVVTQTPVWRLEELKRTSQPPPSIPTMNVGRELQELGARYRNQYGTDVWVNLAISGIHEDMFAQSQTAIWPRYVIHDMRYVNEHQALRNAFSERYMPIRVALLGEPGADTPFDDSGRDANHESEREIGDIPVQATFYNTGTKEQLETLVRSYMDETFAAPSTPAPTEN